MKNKSHNIIAISIIICVWLFIIVLCSYDVRSNENTGLMKQSEYYTEHIKLIREQNKILSEQNRILEKIYLELKK